MGIGARAKVGPPYDDPFQGPSGPCQAFAPIFAPLRPGPQWPFFDLRSELDRSLDQVEQRSPCARRLVSLAVKIGNDMRIDAALDRLLKLGCESPEECVKNFTFAADVETRRGANRHALAFAKKAWEAAPDREDLLVDFAKRAEAQSSQRDALEAFTRLVDKHPDEKQWAEGAARARDALTRGLLERH